MSRDSLTVLHSMGLPMAKRWLSNGTIEPYSKAKNFRPETLNADNLPMLSTMLSVLESEPNACIIRGRPKPGVDTPMRRLIENVDDLPLHAILIEVDEYQPLLSKPLDEPLTAALEYVEEMLPACFHGASFHWQCSNSMGAPGKDGLLKIHLWFWLSTPYDSATLRAWAKSIDLQADKTVLNPVQVHYTAAPVFETGRSDPVAQRSGLWRGARDEVDLVIDTEALDVRHAGVRLRGERREIDDPLADWIEGSWETHGELPNGGLIVSCPFESHHSGGVPGDTSTCYFPAGTNGYPEGRWVCKHDHCHGKSQIEFTDAAGYVPDRFQGLALIPPPEINGHDIADAPWFDRDNGGRIFPTINNIKAGVGYPPMIGGILRYDEFRDEIVFIEEDSDVWRPFTDKDYTTIRLRLEKQGFLPTPKADVRDLIHWESREHLFDTARHWLGGLQWDGVPRIETFWIDHFGVDDDAPGYARSVGLYTWTALAARALSPGVQADMVPVLVGAQGLGKSRGVAAMSPVPDFATSMGFHENEVERARKMRGKLVVELPELQGLKSREREEILAWITRSVEHWTPKFMEMTTMFRRRFICFATTNEDDFLDNPTGERRWLPMLIGAAPGFKRVNVEQIAALCEQLWAEGRDQFMTGGIAWKDAEQLAEAEHAKYKAEDAWRSAVSRWLDTPSMADETPRQRKWMTLHEVAEGALAMPAKHVRYSDQRRLGKIMREEGYELTPRKIDGRSVKVWGTLDFV